ncbi:unnamed protein product [Linum trigynum]|uniref:Uncharacterized protein n=1 Tax=Linum trigynum TaxID=586398 RepID=A0AAV2DN69_9ROSI
MIFGQEQGDVGIPGQKAAAAAGTREDEAAPTFVSRRTTVLTRTTRVQVRLTGEDDVELVSRRTAVQ